MNYINLQYLELKNNVTNNVFIWVMKEERYKETNHNAL